MNTEFELQHLIRLLTGFSDFKELLNAEKSYRPTFNVTCTKYGEKYTFIADRYDMMMLARGDDRRAFRF